MTRPLSIPRLRTLLLVCLLTGCSSANAGKGPRVIRSLAEMRSERVVLQRWDLSCGAAALATLLNFQHGDPVSEREVALGLMGRDEYLANPLLVRARQGFSLLDLKRYIDQRGYHGEGFGQLELRDLEERAPILTPVVQGGYSHFVVFRGRYRDRVLLADPAFGTRTMLIEQFEHVWAPMGNLGHVGFVVARADGLPPPDRLRPHASEFINLD
jgi:predicted double-glycine peptidase